MVILIVILSIILGMILIILGICFAIYRLIFTINKKERLDDYRIEGNPTYSGYEETITKMVQHIASLPYEDIYIKSKDRTKLHARLLRGNSNRVAILCHGYHGSAYRDSSGMGPYLYEKDFNVLLIDERAHGLSKGHAITFGHKEKKDLLCWINKMKEMFSNDIEITVFGISMGGATVLMASEYLDKNVKIIADCPYNTTNEILSNSIKKLGLPFKLAYPLLFLSALLFANFNIKKDNASNAIKKSNSKILIIHGTSDSIVPQPISERIYLENKDKVQYETFIGAEHGMSCMQDKERYISLVNNFLDIK